MPVYTPLSDNFFHELQSFVIQPIINNEGYQNIIGCQLFAQTNIHIALGVLYQHHEILTPICCALKIFAWTILSIRAAFH